MIENFFFNYNADLVEVSEILFRGLGLLQIRQEGDSRNVLGGIYFSCSVFSTNIKLEQNSYDYDEKYNYMISVTRDVLSKGLADEKTILLLKEILINLLPKIFHKEIAYEKEFGELVIYK